MPDNRILLVDDDAAILDVLTRFFARQGYSVVGAATGREALDALRSETFPLVILDIKLPDIPGMELLATLRSQSPDTEVILFTGLADLESAIQALRLGAYDYIVKAELRLPDLQVVVERALERRRLSLANRDLLAHLSKAQKELAARRKAELAQIRRIGESLAQPLAPEQLIDGLLVLIWESLPMKILAVKFLDLQSAQTWGGHRSQDEVPPEVCRAFKTWFDKMIQRAAADEPEGFGAARPADFPLKAVLWELVKIDRLVGLVAGGRDDSFTGEESELFRIFILQGEAGFKNYLLFEEVKSLAVRDSLTGLYNHRYFWEMLHQQVGQSRRYGWPLSLLFLDIDNFKTVNDTLGHPLGDLVLKSLAAFLTKEVRQADILCRYGGEEFVVLLPQTTAEQAEAMADRLREGIACTPMGPPDQEVYITVSIGVAGLMPEMDGAALVKAADTALYGAKRTGKNRVSSSVAF